MPLSLLHPRHTLHTRTPRHTVRATPYAPHPHTTPTHHAHTLTDTAQLPKVKADLERTNAIVASVKPRLQATEARLLSIENGTISLESLFAENPGILPSSLPSLPPSFLSFPPLPLPLLHLSSPPSSLPFPFLPLPFLLLQVSFFDQRLEIAQEIAEELENGDWSVEGLGKEEEHDDHH